MERTCSRCGQVKAASEFYFTNRQRCKACHDETVRLWQAKNPSRLRAASDRWRRRNKPKKLALQIAYQKRNPERINARNAKHRAVKRRSRVSWANQQFIKDMYMLAQLVGEATGVSYHVDHIVPLTSRFVCGLHVEDNLQVIPAANNCAKNNLVWPDMPGA